MKKHGILKIVLSVVITFIMCFIAFYMFFNHYMKNLKVELTRLETVENITVNDSGIADAVLKVYDSVGSIENYINKTLVSTGSGFVFKTDSKYGYVLTNYHVIEDATKVYMVLTNNSRVELEVVGFDKYADVAVLKMDKSNVIKVADIKSTSSSRVGDTVFTIGAPLDSAIYYQSVTRGIISGKDRLVEVKSSDDNVIMKVIQTDAAINSGNSGGPLCNSNGEVIGINSLKLASEKIEGMGFAIPIETALEYADAFINNNKIERPYLGVALADRTINGENFVYVYSKENAGSLKNTNIKVGDLITKINNQLVSSKAYLKYELYKYSIGDEISIDYISDGELKTEKVKLIGK